MYSNEVFKEEKLQGEIRVTFLRPEFYDDASVRILASGNYSGIVPCVQVPGGNGVQLSYNTWNMKTLYELLPSMYPYRFKVIAENLLAMPAILKSYGVLKCENIYLSLDRIYVSDDNKVHLVYVPLKSADNKDYSGLFETKLKENISKIVKYFPNVSDSSVAAYLRSMGCDVAAPAQPPVQNIPQPAIPVQPVQNIQPVQNVQPAGNMQPSYNPVPAARFILRSLDGRGDIVITKNEFVIGKSHERADGVVPGSNLVSRAHCKAIIRGDECYLVDTNSLNGTTINGIKMIPGNEHRLINGFEIAIADVKYTFIQM